MFSGVASVGGREIGKASGAGTRRGTISTNKYSREDEEFEENLEKEWGSDWLNYYGHKIDFEQASKDLDDIRLKKLKQCENGQFLADGGPETLKDLLDEQIRAKGVAGKSLLPRGGQKAARAERPTMQVERLATISRPSTASTAAGGHGIVLEPEERVDPGFQSRPSTAPNHRAGGSESLEMEEQSFDASQNAIRVRRTGSQHLVNDPEEYKCMCATDPQILDRFKTDKKLETQPAEYISLQNQISPNFELSC